MNQDKLLPYALTTLQRVKDRIFDNASTITLNGTTNATVLVTGVTIPTTSTPPGLSVGQAIYGSGIPFGTTIAAIGSNSITLSQAATASASNVTLTVYNQQTAYDNVLIRMINGVTQWMERECGNRYFVQRQVINEIYSAYGAKQRFVTAKQMHINFFTSYGDMTANSNVIVNIPTTAGFQVGMVLVNCPLLPAGVFTTITAVLSSTSIQISNTASQTLTASFFQVSGLMSFQWRPGTPSSPSWIDFIVDQFELVEDGKAGLIRLYGVMPRLYNNSVRLSYWAGYLVNWANAGDGVTHTLPSDLTSTCENIVVRNFKRRDLAGKTAEALDGATTTWDKNIDSMDQDTLGHYRMMPGLF